MFLKKILIIDDEQNILESLRGVLEDERFLVETAKTGAEGLLKLRKFQPDIVILDIWIPGEDGLRVLEKIKKILPQQLVIMMSGHGTVETAVKAIKLGAFDFIEKPIHFDKLLVMLEHAFEMQSLKAENQILRDAIEGEEQLIGQSSAMLRLKKVVALTAPSNGWVMIQGENGTGKELVARTLHRDSPRAKQRFVAVNCAAIPDDLIESELFGHEKGSFTGAHERKIGKFELANGGTLFLDEVGDMGSKMQAKILRALEECVIQRVGGHDSIELDLRVVCASNKDLRKEIKLGNFREDLFYRLNVIPIQVPSLRERSEDLPLLVAHFVNRFSNGKKNPFSKDHLSHLKNYPWPGNIRELKNWVERACILSSGDMLELPDWKASSEAESVVTSESEDTTLREARANFEKQFILRVLSENGGNVSKTAVSIGVERSHLHKKIKAFGIEITDQGGNG